MGRCISQNDLNSNVSSLTDESNELSYTREEPVIEIDDQKVGYHVNNQLSLTISSFCLFVHIACVLLLVMEVI